MRPLQLRAALAAEKAAEGPVMAVGKARAGGGAAGKGQLLLRNQARRSVHDGGLLPQCHRAAERFIQTKPQHIFLNGNGF